MDDIEFKAEKTISCPIATQDIPVNLKNRQNAIDNGGYGPLNPTQANNAFWKKKASRWNVTIGESKKQTCGNCAAFIRTPRMLDCIDKGLGNEKGNTAWDVIDAGELGYCESFDFKCASARTCDAWIVGGPITKEKGKKQETKSLENFLSAKESDAIEFVESLSNREFVALFPNEYTDEANDVKWLFDVSYDFADRLINSRHAGAIPYNEKSAKLRDPEGGLTSAGRKYFNKKEGANLKPGVKGPADTPEKMRRKGSFLVRFFTNPSGPMQDDKGKPTRLALSAAAWGEPVPKTAAAAAKLAAKGSRLLERYKNHKEAQKKKDAFGDIEIKAAAPQTIGSSGGSTIGQSNASRKPQTIGGRGSSSSSENYNPNARDMDGDGNVQEGTDFMRAAQPRQGTADSMERDANRSRTTDRARGNPPRRNASQPPSTPVVAGNIDLSKRKPVTLPSGEKATVRSVSIGTEKGEILIPTIGPNGENWDPDTRSGLDAAKSQYEKTGQHLGIFKTPDEASAYGEWLHNQEAERIGEATDRRRGNAPRTDDRANPPASAITDITMPKADIEKAIREGRATRNSDGTVSFNRSRVWDTESGSADTRERAIQRDNLEGMGFDGVAFRKFIDAESRKLKPGQKTNWNPGRLPNGGKIAADGTYIPPDMVREDDKRASDYYRERREARANAPRPKITREGDVVPDKNRDRIPPGKPTTRSGSADAQGRRAEAEERRRTGQGQGYDKIESQAEMDAYRASYGLPPVPFNPKPSNKPSNKPNTTKPSLLLPGLPNKPRTGWLSPYFAGDYAYDPMDD